MTRSILLLVMIFAHLTLIGQSSDIEASVKRSVGKLKAKLELNKGQTEQVRVIQVVYHQNLAEIAALKEAAPKSYYLKKKKVREFADDSIRKILISKQKSRFDQMIKERDSMASEILFGSLNDFENKSSLLKAAALY